MRAKCCNVYAFNEDSVCAFNGVQFGLKEKMFDRNWMVLYHSEVAVDLTRRFKLLAARQMTLEPCCKLLLHAFLPQKRTFADRQINVIAKSKRNGKDSFRHGKSVASSSSCYFFAAKPDNF